METKFDAHEYLSNVIANWTTFCEEHKLFRDALLAILSENERLREKQ